MIDQQLADYIKQEIGRGISAEEIKTELFSKGWQADVVEEAFGNMSAAPVQKKKSKWKIIILIIIAIVLLVVFLPGILGIFSKDIAPIDDSDLRLSNITVAQSDNAYYDLIKLNGNVVYEPNGKMNVINDMIAGKAWDDSFAEEIISRNSEAFLIFSEAARKPKFQDPAFADSSKSTNNTIISSMSNWRKMGRLSAIRAIYLAKQEGKDKEAIDEALTAVKIGQKIQDSQAPTVEYLIAIALKETGLETVQEVIASSKLNNEELDQLNKELNKFYKNEDGFIVGLKGEYLTASQGIDAIISGNEKILNSVEENANNIADMAKNAKNSFYFHPNETKAIFAENTRVGIKNADKFCGQIQIVDIQRLAPTSFLELYMTENAIGKILHDVVMISSSALNKKKCEEDLLVGSTQAIIAIKAFKNETGNYPASLAELVPKYLSSIPLDYFDGKSLKYSSQKKIIYSVGQDMKDSGGSTGNDWKTMEDPTFKINF